jgi:hypothetical protein
VTKSGSKLETRDLRHIGLVCDYWFYLHEHVRVRPLLSNLFTHRDFHNWQTSCTHSRLTDYCADILHLENQREIDPHIPNICSICDNIVSIHQFSPTTGICQLGSPEWYQAALQALDYSSNLRGITAEQYLDNLDQVLLWYRECCEERQFFQHHLDLLQRYYTDVVARINNSVTRCIAFYHRHPSFWTQREALIALALLASESVPSES